MCINIILINSICIWDKSKVSSGTTHLVVFPFKAIELNFNSCTFNLCSHLLIVHSVPDLEGGNLLTDIVNIPYTVILAKQQSINTNKDASALF